MVICDEFFRKIAPKDQDRGRENDLTLEYLTVEPRFKLFF
jgi:hypothetical protein